jgi:predicted Zn-dependent protease
MNRNDLPRASLGSAIALLVLWAVSCAMNPVTGKKEFMLLSAGDELALGRQTDPEIVKSYGHYDDAALNAYVSGIGKRLGALSHRPDLDYSFKVLDSPVVNAFAVPGGFVYLTRGILAYLNDEAELAGVIGHEIGHIAARHSAQQYSRAQVAQLGLGLGSALSKTFRKYAGLAEAGMSLLFLSYSRDNERQADDLGVLYSSKAGYDAREMANMFVTLERLNPAEGKDGLPAWFSTHPNPPDRIVAIQKAAQEWQSQNPQVRTAANRDAYLQKLGGLVFGDDPRHGYVDGQVFYHPELRFQFPFPSGWTVNNTASQVQIFNANKDAVILLSMAAEKTPGEAAQAFIAGTKASVVRSEDIRVNGLPAHRLVADVTTEQGVIRALAHFIQKDDRVYAFLGYTAQAQFNTHGSAFDRTLGGFANLTAAARINVKPERLAVRKTARQGSLRQALQGFGVPQDKLEPHAVLNGKKLDDTVPAGTLIKVVVK